MSSSPKTRSAEALSATEIRSGISLAGVFGLRMLGLFLVLPVFSVFAKSLPGGESLMWAGVAMGAFALTQACLQIPFGFAADRFGRKPVIYFGLSLYAAGCLLAAWAPDIWWMIAARCLQGAGAISAAVSALAADLTREQHRAKIMAMIGAAIGLVFALSLIAAPALYGWIGMAGMFEMIAALAVLAMAVVAWAVPAAPRSPAPLPGQWRVVLGDAQLLRLDFGVFVKHMIQMALFLVIPRILVERFGMPLPSHWQIYLPVVLLSFVAAVPAIIYAERRFQMKRVFLCSIAAMAVSQIGFLWGQTSLFMLVAMLFLFFVAFNILEASLPALVSRMAPPQAKGLALGAYNTAQALGAGSGAAAGGALALHFGLAGVCGVAVVLCAAWWLCACGLQLPAIVARRAYVLAPGVDVDAAEQALREAPGVAEVAVEREARIARLKINVERWDEQSLRHLIGGKA